MDGTRKKIILNKVTRTRKYVLTYKWILAIKSKAITLQSTDLERLSNKEGSMGEV